MSSGSLLVNEQILFLLENATPRIAAATDSLSLAQLHSHPEHNEWSANDMLAHLRSCADVWGNCMREIVAEDRPTIRAVNPRTWINQTDYLDQQFKTSFRAFSVQRADLLAFLKSLPSKSWSRTAIVTGAGKPLVRTMHSYAQRLARHEQTHIKQIEYIVNVMDK